MESKPFLTVDRQKVRVKLGKTNKEVQVYIDTIKSWFKQQSHLPEVPSDELIEYFLVTNKFSIERTKPKLDLYYTVRNLIPQVFRNQRPDQPHMKETSNIVFYCPLPKMTEELYRVSILKIIGDANVFNAYNVFAHQLNINEIRLQEDLNTGDVIILDLEQLTIGHILKISPIHMKRAVFIIEEVYSSRLKALHLINTPPFVDMLLGIFKNVMKQKMFERIHVHTTIDSISKHIPKDILPKDYGGNEISNQALHDLWLSRLKVYKDRFELLDKMRIDESLRPTPLKNDELLGFHGNFKKLDID